MIPIHPIVSYLSAMLPAAALGLGAYLAVRPARLERLARRGLVSGPRREVLLAVFFMFLTGLLWLTVRPGAGYGKINLRPFLIFSQSSALARKGVQHYFLINFWGNIAMFLPVGLFPALLWRRQRWWKALLCGAGLSMAIELSQIPIGRGTDIDDLILNTLGALLGYGLFCLLRRLAPTWTQGCQVREA